MEFDGTNLNACISKRQFSRIFETIARHKKTMAV